MEGGGAQSIKTPQAEIIINFELKIMEIADEWTQVMDSVRDQIRDRFIKNQEVSKKTYQEVVECFKDSILIILKSLKREEIVEIIS